MTEVTQLAPGVLVLTDAEPIDGRISWVPEGVAGFAPFNEYLLLAEDRALLVDTGVAKHGPGLLAALRPLLGARRLVVWASRIELDVLGNLALLLEAFPEAGIATANPIAPVELIHARAPWRDGPVTHLRLGGDLSPIGFPGVAILDPVMRTLGTSWLLDGASGALFSSDSFAGEMLATRDTPVIRRDDMAGLPDVLTLRAHLRAKFQWLAEAEGDTLAAHWDRLFAAHRPRAIAPAHGRVQAGEALTAEMLRRYRAAMLR
jgi:flavorubredoxin